MAIDNRPGRNAEGYPDPTAREAGANLYELIDRQGKREILERLVSDMEYGKTYCVVLEKSTTNNGFSETVSFDLRFEKMEG